MRSDGITEPEITLPAHQLACLVCVKGGAACPLMSAEDAQPVLDSIASDPTVTIRLISDADKICHFSDGHDALSEQNDPENVRIRKLDLDILQRLGLVPGDTRRSRYLIELLFSRVESLVGICAYDTEGWEGCSVAREGIYEKVRKNGWKSLVYHRSDSELKAAREKSAKQAADDERLFVRPHHLMCMSCWYGGGGRTQRPNDTIYELHQRIQADPDVPITLIEGCCMACDCCDGFHPETTRCVHACGLIRDYKKDLDVFQRLGFMPGATLPAKKLLDRLYSRIESTRDICGYEDGIAISPEWHICGGPEGNPGYAAAREKGIF